MMKLLSRNIVIAILIFLAIASLYPMITGQLKTSEKISLSDLVAQIRDGKVKAIMVQGDTLAITLADGSERVSKKESEAGLTETFRNYGVSDDALKSVAITVEEQSGFLFWVGAVLPFVLPFALVIFFFWMISKQAQQANVQAF